MSNLYATPLDVIERQPELTGKEALLMQLLEEASRTIELPALCGRRFWTWLEARRHTAFDECRVYPNEDLRAISELAVDREGALEFAEVWATTDYELDPVEWWPITAILKVPRGRYCLPRTWQRGAIRITGSWGYGDGERLAPWNTLAVTLGADATAEATTLTLSAPSVVRQGMTLLVGSEQIFVAAVSSATATVERGRNGTTAAVHTSGAATAAAAYPALIRKLAINLVIDSVNELADQHLLSEKIGDYEYMRANLSTFAATRTAQLQQIAGGLRRVA